MAENKLEYVKLPDCSKTKRITEIESEMIYLDDRKAQNWLQEQK